MNLDNMRNALDLLEQAKALVDDEDSIVLNQHVSSATRICRDMLNYEERKLLVNIFKREGKL